MMAKQRRRTPSNRVPIPEPPTRLALDAQQVRVFIDHAIDRVREGRLSDAHENLRIARRFIDSMAESLRK